MFLFTHSRARHCETPTICSAEANIFVVVKKSIEGGVEAIPGLWNALTEHLRPLR